MGCLRASEPGRDYGVWIRGSYRSECRSANGIRERRRAHCRPGFGKAAGRIGQDATVKLLRTAEGWTVSAPFVDLGRVTRAGASAEKGTVPSFAEARSK